LGIEAGRGLAHASEGTAAAGKIERDRLASLDLRELRGGQFPAPLHAIPADQPEQFLAGARHRTQCGGARADGAVVGRDGDGMAQLETLGRELGGRHPGLGDGLENIHRADRIAGAELKVDCVLAIGFGFGVARLQPRLVGLQQRGVAAILTGIAPIEISADSVGLEGVRKLIEVSLLEAAPGAPEGEVRLRPTVKARPYFRERRRGVSGEVSAELCYARRKITRALLVGSDGKTLNFAYRLVDSPAWACDPRLQAAFPFLAPRSLGNWSRRALSPSAMVTGSWILPMPRHPSPATMRASGHVRERAPGRIPDVARMRSCAAEAIGDANESRS